MGRGLRSAVRAFNEGVGTLQGSVLPQARRFRELGPVTGGKQLGEPSSIEIPIRDLNAPELSSGDD